MKKKYHLLFFIPVLVLFSCEQEDVVFNPLKFVDSPPEELIHNKYQCYVEASDIDSSVYSGDFKNLYISCYQDSIGSSITQYTCFTPGVYKIKARRYYNWLNGLQYVSCYKEQYEVSASVIGDMKERIKNVGYAVCYKRSVSGQNDHLGLGLSISGIVK